ncbi:MAG: radical SAM family heme chaperone HemW [Desulfuromonadales bacterium]
MPALYVHIPFCRRKCPYCDFFSLAEHGEDLTAYPDLLSRHLELAPGQGWRGPFESVFFGGGTPSLLPPAAIGRILETAARRFGITAGAEISLEANPGTVTPDTLAGYRAAGVNRLSLGIQSFSPASLRRLGRIHSPQQARAAVAWARQAGFANLSCDLMFATPGQSRRRLLRDLDSLLQLDPAHVSCYGLAIEEDTPFQHQHAHGEFSLPGEETHADFFRLIHERLTDAGFRHYEISNYARPGRECRHNLNYWQRGGYLGIGAGAHSFADSGWGRRLAVPGDLPLYAQRLGEGRDPAEVLEGFERTGAMAETLYLGLRTAAGVDEAAFRRRFGGGVAESFPAAVRHAGQHLQLTAGAWRFDLSGWLLYDHLISPFL